MTKLSQIIPVETDAKKHIEEAVATTLGILDNKELFSGMSRTYAPKDETGETQPAEFKKVQFTATQVLEKLIPILVRGIDLTATKDTTNGFAKADVVMSDGEVLLADVPGVHLLHLERVLNTIERVIRAVPTLDPARNWHPDANTGLQMTEGVSSNRTKKIPQAFVKHPGTDKHPPQVDTIHDDVVVGTWTKVDMSGAWSVVNRDAVLNRIRQLQAAVHMAREQANSTDVHDREFGKVIFNFLFPA